MENNWENEIREATLLNEWMASGQLVSCRKLRKNIGLGTPAEESCLAAIYIALSFKTENLLSMFNYINHCGGDTDTDRGGDRGTPYLIIP